MEMKRTPLSGPTPAPFPYRPLAARLSADPSRCSQRPRRRAKRLSTCVNLDLTAFVHGTLRIVPQPNAALSLHPAEKRRTPKWRASASSPTPVSITALVKRSCSLVYTTTQRNSPRPFKQGRESFGHQPRHLRNPSRTFVPSQPRL